MNIIFDSKIRAAAPALEVLLIEADVTNAPTNDALWHEIEQTCASIRAHFALEDVRHRRPSTQREQHIRPAAKNQTATDPVPRPFADVPSKDSTYTVRLRSST